MVQNYALISGGKVVNVISLDSGNAQEFPDAVLSDIAAIGDEYGDNRFYRNGKLVKTQEEIYTQALQEIDDMRMALAELEIEPEEVEA